MEIHWYIVAQDGPYPWNPQGARTTDLRYLQQLATTIDLLGYEGALIPTLAGGTEPFTLATALATRTERMKFICASYAGVVSPLWMAQIAATVDEVSNGRLIVNVITGNQPTNEALGIMLDHDERYVLADEYWGVFRRLMQGERVDFEGRHVRVRGAELLLDRKRPGVVPLMFGGSSPPALDFAARHVDTWLSLGLPPALIAEKVALVKSLAAKHGRTIRCGLRMHVLVRETQEEAWAAAQWQYDRMDKEAIQRRLEKHRSAGNDAYGGRLLSDLIGVGAGDLPKDARAFEISPNLWGGIGLIRNGPGTTIVGDPDTVVATLREYEKVGIEVFILGAYPHIEEAHRFADMVMPKLQKREARARVAWV